MGRHQDASRSDVPERLLEAAKVLLTRMHPTDITVRDIAAEAGLQHSLITRHYGSRDALLSHAMADVLATLGEEIDNAADLAAAVELCVERPRSDPALTSAVFLLLARGERPAAQRYPIVDALERKLRGGGLAGPAARRAAVAITVLISGWSAAEPWWLQVSAGSGGAGDGRQILSEAIWDLIRAARDRPAP